MEERIVRISDTKICSISYSKRHTFSELQMKEFVEKIHKYENVKFPPDENAKDIISSGLDQYNISCKHMFKLRGLIIYNGDKIYNEAVLGITDVEYDNLTKAISDLKEQIENEDITMKQVFNIK